MRHPPTPKRCSLGAEHNVNENKRHSQKSSESVLLGRRANAKHHSTESSTEDLWVASSTPCDSISSLASSALDQKTDQVTERMDKMSELESYLLAMDRKLDQLCEQMNNMCRGIVDITKASSCSRFECVDNPTKPSVEIDSNDGELTSWPIIIEEKQTEGNVHMPAFETQYRRSASSMSDRRSTSSMSHRGSINSLSERRSISSLSERRSISSLSDTQRVQEKIRSTHRFKIQRELWAFLEQPSSGFWATKYVRLMALAVMASVLLPLFQSIEFGSQPNSLGGIIQTMMEFVFDVLYTVEILIRFLVCPNQWAFFKIPYNIIDLAAGLLPLTIRFAVELDFFSNRGGTEDILRLILLCCVPILRTLKLLRNFEQFHLLLRAFKIASEALPVLLFIQTIMVLFFSALLYSFEPRTNIPFFSTSLWFTIVTMMTVGYGDIVPVSPTGRIITSMLIICSSLYMAMPLGIVGDAFSRVWVDRDKLLLVKFMRDQFDQCGYTAQDIPKLFNLFDSTKTGELNLQEFTDMIGELKLTLGNERILELFEALDTNRSGAIDDEEFVRSIFPNHYVKIYGDFK